MITETTSATNLDGQVHRAVSIVFANISHGESIVWRGVIVINTIFLFAVILFYAYVKVSKPYILFDVTSNPFILVSIGVIAMSFIPILFRLTFGEYPLTWSLRGALENEIKSQATVSLSGFRRVNEVVPVSPFVIEEIKDKADSSVDPRQLLALYGESTSKLAEKIFKRSNAHLFAGGVIAAVGIAVFLFRSSQITSASEWKEMIRILAPGFGILFFIELVAFFFLRQYRAAMDDYRYFDAVRRSREESLVILKMFAENPNEVSTKDVLAAMSIYSSAGKLGKDETTEMLEVRKMQRDETFVFEKLAEIWGALKEIKGGERK